MFHFVKEGEFLHFGINMMKPCKRTAWSIKFKIPIWIYKEDRWQDFDSMNVFKGYRILCLLLRIRRRAKNDFPKGHSLWIFSKAKARQPIGKQELVWTREQVEDHFDATVGWYDSY